MVDIARLYQHVVTQQMIDFTLSMRLRRVTRTAEMVMASIRNLSTGLSICTNTLSRRRDEIEVSRLLGRTVLKFDGGHEVLNK